MSSEPARYDAIADWYIEFTKDWDSEPLALRPDDLRGLRSWTWPVATAGPAGTWPSEGRESVVLISRPPCCPGTAAGSRPAPRDPLRPQRRRLHRLVGRCGHDGVLCNMALMDIDDLEGTLSTVAAVLAPGGWFSFSVCHPRYPGGPEGSWSGLPSPRSTATPGRGGGARTAKGYVTGPE